jgi:hypothetical protein
VTFAAADFLAPAVAPAPAAAAAAPAAPADPVAVDRTVTDPRIAESSGLAPSLTHPGVLWTHNDSGNTPVLYALRRDGSTAAAVRLNGTTDRDWEAIAAYRDAAGRAMLAVADTGDNAAARAQVEVVLLPEPALRSGTVHPARVLRLRYPDGAVDAETLLIDPVAHRMYVVSKGFGSTVFAVPAPVWPGVAGAAPRDDGTLVRVATVPLILVTDGVVAPDGHVLLRTYGELAVLRPITDEIRGGSLQPLVTARLPAQPQGESIAWVDSRTVLLGTEGARQPVLRWTLPTDVAALLHDTASTAADGSAAGGVGAAVVPAGSAGKSDGSGASGSWSPSRVAALAAGVITLAAGGLVLRRRARRRF